MPDAPAPLRLVICAGHATLDAIVAVPRMPRPDERLPATAGTLAGGGPAATAAVTLARLGFPVAFAGRVGDDEAGRLIRAGLADEGVDVGLLETVDGRSPFTAVLVDPDGGRVLVPVSGQLPPPRLTDALRARLPDAAWIHLDHVGASLLPSLRAAGIRPPVSIDGGNPIPDLSLDGVALYGPTEAALLAHTGAPTLVAGLEAALAEGARLVVATRGAAGAVAAWRDDAGRVATSSAAAPVVDGLASTLGAGDVFHGALLASLVEGRAIEDALAHANAAAAASTRALDGRSAIPGRDGLEAVLAARPGAAR